MQATNLNHHHTFDNSSNVSCSVVSVQCSDLASQFRFHSDVIQSLPPWCFTWTFRRGELHYQGVYFRDRLAQSCHISTACLLNIPKYAPLPLPHTIPSFWVHRALDSLEAISDVPWLAHAWRGDLFRQALPQFTCCDAWEPPRGAVFGHALTSQPWCGRELAGLEELRVQPCGGVWRCRERESEPGWHASPCPPVWIVIGSDLPSQNRNTCCRWVVFMRSLRWCWTLTSLDAVCAVLCLIRACFRPHQMVGQFSCCSQTCPVRFPWLFAEKRKSEGEDKYCVSCSTVIVHGIFCNFYAFLSCLMNDVMLFLFFYT